MVFSYEEKLIIKYIRIKCKQGATRILNDHPENEWDVKLCKKTVKKN